MASAPWQSSARPARKADDLAMAGAVYGRGSRWAAARRDAARPQETAAIVDLQSAINRYLAETNDNPKPFTWTADPDAIIQKVRRGKQGLESIR